MFHEDPQMPQFRDGEPRVYDPSGLADDEINPEDLKQMEETFREFDQDKDEYLTSSDVYKVLAKHRDEPMFPDAVEQWERQSDEELKKAAEEMMEGYDTNKDGRLTMKEWIGGGGF
uniref:EF-hand domain-containing protein n=2 Tax=Hemiselmis andersenii TaxID=464988 RepID=A0A7S1DFA6_HEMAN|mmetsp:Transcript_1014/g.2491  ORF Transcript_1014/g.2491 Transcript_1014/m.2491 type:complete len:116 (+) Transcript_1014:43-390(+)